MLVGKGNDFESMRHINKSFNQFDDPQAAPLHYEE
jgi:hypothetical protein